MKIFISILLLYLLSFPVLAADCTSPHGVESQTRFDAGILYYCNGTNWIRMDTPPGAGGLGCIVGNIAIPPGGSGTFYSATSDADCASIGQARTCTNGVLSGSGAYSHPFCSNAADTTPDAFSFIDVSAPISMVTSNTIHITGINAPTTVAVSGDGSGQISINGGAWVTSGTIANGQTLTVRMKVVDSNTYIATIDVGGVTDTWTVSPPTPCGSGGTGREVGGYCWYSGADGQSCTDVCASHGGYNNATGTFAGSSGSNSNCNAVLTMLGKGTGNAGDTSVGGIGCYVSFSNSRGRSINPTTAAATNTYASRACACND